MEIYEGSENYIFISYAHKNSAQVMRVVEQLYARGYRIWYDKGITPGGEWPEIIARHLANCSAVLAFITPEFVASVNCRREMTFADSHKKQRLSIILEETEIPLGVEFQISLHQYIKRMNFRSEDAFLNRICQCEFLDSCKQKPNASIPDVSVRSEKPSEVKVVHHHVISTEKVRPEKPAFPSQSALVLAAAAVFLVLAGAYGAWKLTTKASDIHISAPETIQTEAPTAVAEETYSSVEMIGFDYAYSDDPADNAKYTAEEFAEVVKSENVRELLPLGTRIKMIPDSEKITDEFIEFELVAYKHFERADGSDMAETTWLAVNLLNEERTMNKRDTNSGGWRDSKMRAWLNETLYPSLPSYWKNLMVQVAVSSTAGEYSEETVTSADYLFLPAIGEMDTKYLTKSENSVFYSSEISSGADEQTFIRFIDDDASRVKKRQGNPGSYWLRSPYLSSNSFYDINSGGSYASYANASHGVCLGFCLGESNQESSSSVRKISDFDYAYSDDPSDSFMYTAEEFAKVVKSENVRELLPLGTRIKMVPNSKEITDEFIEFELVAYKHFERADGLGMAKTTWLAVDLLNEERAMNKRDTNSGGWPKSELRGWLNEILYPTLPEYWKNLIVCVQISSVTGGKFQGIVDIDDYLFIPSLREVDSDYLSSDEYYKSEIATAAEEQMFAFSSGRYPRRKRQNGEAGNWWLRTVYAKSTNSFNIVNSINSPATINASFSNGVCPGFCM